MEISPHKGSYPHMGIHPHMDRTHTCINAYMHISTHAHMRKCIYANMRRCIYTYMDRCMYAYMHTRTIAWMHICINAYMHLDLVKLSKMFIAPLPFQILYQKFAFRPFLSKTYVKNWHVANTIPKLISEICISPILFQNVCQKWASHPYLSKIDIRNWQTFRNSKKLMRLKTCRNFKKNKEIYWKLESCNFRIMENRKLWDLFGQFWALTRRLKLGNLWDGETLRKLGHWGSLGI